MHRGGRLYGQVGGLDSNGVPLESSSKRHTSSLQAYLRSSSKRTQSSGARSYLQNLQPLHARLLAAPPAASAPSGAKDRSPWSPLTRRARAQAVGQEFE